MSAARDRLIARAKVPTEKLMMDLTEPGATEQVMQEIEVRGMTAGACGRLLNTVMIEDVENGGQKIDMAKLGPLLVVECTYDTEENGGKRLFSEADFDMVMGLEATTLDPIVALATKLSGLGTGVAKAVEKNS